VWAIGFVVIGLVAAHLAGSSSGSHRATVGGSTSGGVDDPLGKVIAIAPAHRVRAAAIAGPLLGGGTYDPAASAGHVRVVNAWGSWCTPCQQELPALRRLALATYASPVDFLGLDEEEPSTAAGQGMARRYALPYTSVYDEDGSVYGALAPALAASGVPGTVVIDKQGRVAGTVIGAVDEAQLAAYLQQLAAAPA
jgi:thiol-disulfide isomerase/thioredoxin